MLQRLSLAHRFLLSAALLFCGDGCETCQGIDDDAAALLQSKRSKGPHVEHAALFSENANAWAKASRKRFNHHRHNHEKVVDDTDYRKDCKEAHEQVTDLPLADRCPLKSMTLAEVQAKWIEGLEKMTEKMEKASKKERLKTYLDMKRDFADSLDNSKPVIVQGNVPKQLGWTAADHWQKDELANFLGDTEWYRTTFNYPDWVAAKGGRTTLKDYISHNESKDDIFLFVSERGCDEDSGLKSLVDKLRDQFSPSPDWGYGPESCQAIIAIDGIGSSHGFHCHDPVWNTQVEGVKQWWLLDPFYGSDMQNEMGIMDWGAAPKVNATNQSFEYPNACAMLKEVEPPPGALKCTMKPGEMIILPEFWMHATCGLSEFTIAAGGWLSDLEDHDEDDED